jgi:hypothetical protein
MKMENDDFLKDDFLRELIRQTPDDEPGADFTDRVMAAVGQAPEPVAETKPYYTIIKGWFPFLLLTFVICLALFTSDLPGFGWIPGKAVAAGWFSNYFGLILTTFKTVFASRFILWGLMVAGSAGMLFSIDWFFSRRIGA